MTDSQAEPEVPVLDAGRAIGSVELRNAYALEIHGVRRDADLDGAETLGEDGEPLLPQLELFIQDSDEGISVRARGEFESPLAKILVDAAVDFEKLQPFQLSEEGQVDFVTKLGLRTLFPYLRMHVQDTSSRLGAPFTPRLIRLGPQLKLERAGEDEATDAE